MKIDNSEKKLRVALLGFGLDNQALLSFFDKYKAPIDLTICDLRSLLKLPPHETKNLELTYRLGKNFNHNLGEFDLLFRSPGWPISCPGIQAALKKGSELSSPLNLFFELCPSKNIIGVSGTKGKGTTATLIYKSLQDNFRKEKNKQKVFLGGNIGITPISFLEKIKKDDFVV
jgi:UDP-N-acetylmuramoylalanine--D-glutamate ligase